MISDKNFDDVKQLNVLDIEKVFWGSEDTDIVVENTIEIFGQIVSTILNHNGKKYFAHLLVDMKHKYENDVEIHHFSVAVVPLSFEDEDYLVDNTFGVRDLLLKSFGEENLFICGLSNQTPTKVLHKIYHKELIKFLPKENTYFKENIA